MNDLLLFTTGIALSIFIGYPSYRRRLLSKGGWAAATIVGLLVLLTGFQSFLVLLAFFASSQVATKLKYDRKAAMGAAENPGGRTWKQVLGAGGVAAVSSAAAFAAYRAGYTNLASRLLVASLAAMSASTADTWAAEIGALSKALPRLVTRPWVKVPPGTSGGVTLLGEAAAAAGALTIALVTCLVHSSPFTSPLWATLPTPTMLLAAVLAGGWVGELVDAAIGSTLQEKYYCPRCRVLTDRRVHVCGSPTVLAWGSRLFTNEVTNLLSTLVAALVGFILA